MGLQQSGVHGYVVSLSSPVCLLLAIQIGLERVFGCLASFDQICLVDFLFAWGWEVFPFETLTKREGVEKEASNLNAGVKAYSINLVVLLHLGGR